MIHNRYSLAKKNVQNIYDGKCLCFSVLSHLIKEWFTLGPLVLLLPKF
jgi:hypothetical protein